MQINHPKIVLCSQVLKLITFLEKRNKNRYRRSININGNEDVIQSVTQATRKKIRVLPKEVEPTKFFSPDALPLSYRRLVGAKATKLASCEKHLAYCLDWNVDMCFLNEAMIEI